MSDAYDKTFEVENKRLDHPNITYTDNADDIRRANYIITVPTPITNINEPDISYLITASQTVGKRLKAGDLVVYESTVYPGCTEEDCMQYLRQSQNSQPDRIFMLAILPNALIRDMDHRFETILKIVSAQCPQSLKIVADTYGAVVTAGIYQAPSIKVFRLQKS